MNAEIFAEWLRRQGHIVIKTQSSYWVDFGPRVLQAFPYHWVIEPSEDELTSLLKEQKALGLRYSSPFSVGQGAASYHTVYEGMEYGYETLGKWARKNVRRGLSYCRVEPVSFERLAEEGFDLQVDTLARQGRKLPLEKQTWQIRCLAAKDLPGFEAWGALVNDRLAASVITFQMGDWGYMLYQQCHRDFLTYHVNNALSFVVTQTLMERPEMKAILYGLHSLDAPPSVDEFKFRMGYTAKPVRQRVVFHPWLRPFMNRASHALLRAGLRLKPAHPILSKAEGMLRFYLQGRLPLEKQSLPPPLQSK